MKRSKRTKRIGNMKKGQPSPWAFPTSRSNVSHAREFARVSRLRLRRSLLTLCPRKVWKKAGESESLSVTSQLTVESRIDRAENP